MEEGEKREWARIFFLGGGGTWEFGELEIGRKTKEKREKKM